MLSWGILAVGFIALAPLAALVQRLWPALEGVPPALAWSRRRDWLYWLVTPAVTGLAARAVVLGVAGALVVVRGDVLSLSGDPIRQLGWTQVPSTWPFALQLPVALVLTDFLAYWSHRARHAVGLFPLHAIHHAPRELDWLAAARMHPLDEILDSLVVSLPIVLAGFSTEVLFAVEPLLMLHTLYVHAATRIEVLPGLLVTPAMHRDHHRESAPYGNFGGVLAIWDRSFGTYVTVGSGPFGVAGLRERGIFASWAEALRRWLG